MPGDHFLGKTQLAANIAHFVLEQLAQRLDQLEFHPGLEPAHVVVRLDRHRRSTARREGLDHVRIKGPLHQEVDVVTHLRGCVLEHVDERVADDRPLLLGFFDTRQRIEEALLGVDGDQLDSQMRAKGSLYLLALVQTQQPRVDENAGELVADRAVHQRGGD